MKTRLLDSRWYGRRIEGGSVLAVATVLLACTAGCACTSAETETGIASAPGVASRAYEETAPMGNVPSTTLAAALDDAVQRTSLQREAIEVILAEAVTWPDGSLGCPQPGMMYTQALVPGYRIVLRAGAEVLNYHAGRSGAPRFCPSGQVVPPAPGSGADRA